MSQMHSTEELTFDLHDRLHKSLRVSGLSSKTLGDRIGVHRNTISNYLAGRTAVDRRTLIAWAFATGVPVEWLEHGTVPDPAPQGTPAVTGRYPVLIAA